ncbi:hypothetical protein JDV02_005497 [Purpureocillium takamizusanense]|uniref:SET domain-containing protein n=1 Tax=Purpureocillium takamizusanense TaxID=2060973 RepID=A0A9Q8QGQ2_9HYPO|nr:uncharacterized protein JDV02_005497 [Purpureocillium takamizusanense]UNI19305.1 hypothetical protein JDV02_005497 [Purpureocillium takamizusanense]
MWFVRVAVVGSLLSAGVVVKASAGWLTNVPRGDVCVNTPLRVVGCLPPVIRELEILDGPATSPWTFKPLCIMPAGLKTPLCVFTSHAFANGRGISIVTSPRIASNIHNLTAFAQWDTLTQAGELAAPPFEVRELPGRGKGGIANTTLHRGDRILAATPALLIDMRVYSWLNEMDGIELERIAVRQLPPKAHEMFWELHNAPKTNSVRDRISINAFAVEAAGGRFSGVVLETSRFNHDCRPNSAYYFDEETLTHYTHAVTNISPGTEISLTYISPLSPRSHRQKSLASTWGFGCTCSQCSMHPKMVKQSDLRVNHIQNMTRMLYGWHERMALDQELAYVDEEVAAGAKGAEEKKVRLSARARALNRTIPHLSNQEVIATAETIISMFRQERLDVYSSDAHLLAALAYCAEGRRFDTIRHAQLSIETGLIHEGLDDELHFDVAQLAKDPTTDPCWPKAAAAAAAENSTASEEASKASQEGSKASEESPKVTEESPKASEEVSKASQESPKTSTAHEQ